MNLIKTAVILTVYNRKEVTLNGLRSLYRAIKAIGRDYSFDVYMTDDGCTDGTGEAVAKEFPEVKIIQGDGNLYWSGGMRKAWQAAMDGGVKYDFFLWYNDDSDLYTTALITLFKDLYSISGNAILSGAFCDEESNASYGGKKMDRTIVVPNGKPQEIKLMNGNLVLIPMAIYQMIGNIDSHYMHGLGDYDYGLRAQRAGLPVFLTSEYVGVATRHDEQIPSYFSNKKNLAQRWKNMHDPKNAPSVAFRFNYKYMGLKKAIIGFARNYIYMFFPALYLIKKH